jgi:hypothetical protein
VTGFDWAPYFQGVEVNGLLITSMTGALALGPIIVMRMAPRISLEIIRIVKELTS